MRTPCRPSGELNAGKSAGKTMLWFFPFLLFSIIMFLGGRALPQDPLRLIPLLFTVVLVNLLFFLMMRTGRTDRYRAVYFILMAVCFVISFLSHFQEARGSMSVNEAEMIKGRTPFCHMVIPQTFITSALTQTIIFPGSMLGPYSIASMLVLWLGASLALGRGFCAWGCFFGGLEDGFSRFRKKALIQKIGEKWTYLPYAVLMVVMLASTAALSPFYCTWLCPFKAVTEYAPVTSFTIFFQTVLFLSLFLGLVVVLPILTKKRTQCGLFCPMGAFQSFTNKINPFEVRIDQSRCQDCGKCLQVCPTFSLDQSHAAAGRTRFSCVKCGKCMDECPQGAISYHVKGTIASTPAQANWARMLFIYPAFLFLAVFGGGMIQDGLYRLLLFFTSGSFIQ